MGVFMTTVNPRRELSRWSHQRDTSPSALDTVTNLSLSAQLITLTITCALVPVKVTRFSAGLLPSLLLSKLLLNNPTKFILVQRLHDADALERQKHTTLCKLYITPLN